MVHALPGGSESLRQYEAKLDDTDKKIMGPAAILQTLWQECNNPINICPTDYVVTLRTSSVTNIIAACEKLISK